jgi:type II secretory pathway pseudopilin PulG
MTYRTSRSARGGFSLIEAVVAIAVVGFGVASLMVAMASGTQVNARSEEITQATFLAQQIREWTMTIPFYDQDEGDKDNPPGPDGTDPQTFVDDLDDLMGVTYSPPRDGEGDPLSDMDGWSQTIEISPRRPDDIRSEVQSGWSTVLYVEVTIRRDGREVLRTGWYVTRRQWE